MRSATLSDPSDTRTTSHSTSDLSARANLFQVVKLADPEKRNIAVPGYRNMSPPVAQRDMEHRHSGARSPDALRSGARPGSSRTSASSGRSARASAWSAAGRSSESPRSREMTPWPTRCRERCSSRHRGPAAVPAHLIDSSRKRQAVRRSGSPLEATSVRSQRDAAGMSWPRVPGRTAPISQTRPETPRVVRSVT